jgi:hypothetical protein
MAESAFRNACVAPLKAKREHAIRSETIGSRSKERAVLTFGCAGARRASWFAVPFGAAIMLTLMTSAYAQEITTSGCVGGWRSFSCVTRWGPATDPFIRIVPQPLDEAATARAIERDRRWVDRCRPMIRHDRYGVGRYQYAAPGCEFGIIEY